MDQQNETDCCFAAAACLENKSENRSNAAVELTSSLGILVFPGLETDMHEHLRDYIGHIVLPYDDFL